MSDTDARLKVTADTTGAVGPLDDLNKTQQKVGDTGQKTGAELSAAYTSAATSVDKFAKQVESGGKGAERGLAQATIQLQKLEAEIASLKAQGKPTAALETGLETLRGKLAASTEGLGRFRAAAADAADATRKATQRAGEFSGSISDVTGTLKTLSPALSNAIDKYSILAAKAFALASAAKLVTAGLHEVTTGSQTTSEGFAKTETGLRANVDATDKLLASILRLDIQGTARDFLNLAGTVRATSEGLYDSALAFGKLTDAKKAYNFAQTVQEQARLVEGHNAEVAALDRKAAALVREIETQKQAGEVQKYVRDEVQKTIDGYVNAGEPIDEALAEQAKSLGIVATAQKQTEESASRLADVSEASADRRAKAEAKASDEVVAALEREKAALDAKIAQDEERLNRSLGAGGKIDTSGDADAAKSKVANLREEIQRLENQPMLDPAEQNKLNELKDQAGKAAAAVRDLGKVFTQTADDFLTEAEAADAGAAAWDLYRDRVDRAAIAHEEAMRSTDDAAESLGDFTDTAEDAGRALEDAADAGASIGDETKKGADKAKEGLSNLNEGFDEAIPKATQLRDILAEIVSLGAQADI